MSRTTQTGACPRESDSTTPLAPRASQTAGGDACVRRKRNSAATNAIAAVISRPLGFTVAARKTTIGVIATTRPSAASDRCSGAQSRKNATAISASASKALTMRMPIAILSGLTGARATRAGSRYGNGW